MQVHHIYHLARAYAGVTNDTHFIIAGLGSLMPYLDKIPAFESHFEELDTVQVMVEDNDDPHGMRDLVNTLLGKDSPFYQYYGYCVEAVLGYEKLMPTRWTSRVKVLNASLRYSPTILSISTTDFVLADMANATGQTDPMLYFTLVQRGHVEIPELRARLDKWTDLSPRLRMGMYSQIQTIENMVRSEAGKIQDLDDDLADLIAASHIPPFKPDLPPPLADEFIDQANNKILLFPTRDAKRRLSGQDVKSHEASDFH